MKRFTSVGLTLFLISRAFGQDSVALTQGNSDAISPYVAPFTRQYVVDLVPINSSWGNEYLIGPVLKASADNDPLFSTQLLGSIALSPDQLTALTFPSRSYLFWSTPGAGINATENSPAGSLSVTGFDRQFGLALSDLASAATNVIGATIGQNAALPNRVFVTRTQAISSRTSGAGSDSGTVSLGGIDAGGQVAVRIDGFNSAQTFTVQGENIVRVSLPTRSAGLNALFFDGTANVSLDPGATTLLVNNSTITTNTPSLVPASLIPGSSAVVFDFAGGYLPDGGTSVTTHLDAAIDAHRGNPSFSTLTPLGGVGTIGSLARTNIDALVSSINVYSVDAAGAPVATQSAKLPSPITDGAFSTNTAGTAQFLQYMSQVSFRGGNGQVALGQDPISGFAIAAATATDPTDGQFIAVAQLNPAGASWSIAAHNGKQVLDGLGGSPIGSLAAASPVSLSSPAADLQGNIYFIGAFQPTIGMATTGLFRAVNTASGYQLELLLKAGDAIVGANSTRTYTVDKLVLGDSDSIASGSMFSASVLQPTLPGITISGPEDPRSAGGVIASASIIYNNAGTPETYQAVLFLTGNVVIPTFCDGDANGDGTVNFTDITSVLGNFIAANCPAGQGTCGNQGVQGDANNDGVVNFSDVIAALGVFNTVCP